jgi:5-methylcytosine-specific restriction endonuclease McrA
LQPNLFKLKKFDSKEIGRRTPLMLDEDVKQKAFTLCIDTKRTVLNIRAFSDNQKREALKDKKGVCVKCGVTFELNEMEADYTMARRRKTTAQNCQMLCRHDNRIKSGK